MFELMRRLVEGRYGNDSLNQFLMISGLVLLAVWSFARFYVLMLLFLVCILLCYLRMFSRNIAKRQAENQKFLNWWQPLTKGISDAWMRLRDRKTHRYFKCKCCKTWLRVPRGRGKINIKCPKCGNEFVKKT